MSFSPESNVPAHPPPSIPSALFATWPLFLLLPFPCSEAGWKGVVGEVPSPEQVQAALTEHDLYM